MKGWFEIFRVGTQTSTTGKVKTWTRSDIDKIVNRYDPLMHEAPLVIGYPKSTDAAWGWVRTLKRKGDALFMKAIQVDPSFEEMVKAGRFKQRSISFYPDGSLRYVGFIGANPPAVIGLKYTAISGEETETFEFSEHHIKARLQHTDFDDDEKVAREIAGIESNHMENYTDFDEDEMIANEIAGFI